MLAKITSARMYSYHENIVPTTKNAWVFVIQKNKKEKVKKNEEAKKIKIN